mmetsp:Transcript_28306/g.46537  ORF Transcript_28306/g.46537 Transcript_28306/m.46537 type:complete len:237 (-) Transcript_28306:558-1268(-)
MSIEFLRKVATRPIQTNLDLVCFLIQVPHALDPLGGHALVLLNQRDESAQILSFCRPFHLEEAGKKLDGRQGATLVDVHQLKQTLGFVAAQAQEAQLFAHRRGAQHLAELPEVQLAVVIRVVFGEFLQHRGHQKPFGLGDGGGPRLLRLRRDDRHPFHHDGQEDIQNAEAEDQIAEIGHHESRGSRMIQRSQDRFRHTVQRHDLQDGEQGPGGGPAIEIRLSPQLPSGQIGAHQGG